MDFWQSLRKKRGKTHRLSLFLYGSDRSFLVFFLFGRFMMALFLEPLILDARLLHILVIHRDQHAENDDADHERDNKAGADIELEARARDERSIKILEKDPEPEHNNDADNGGDDPFLQHSEVLL